MTIFVGTVCKTALSIVGYIRAVGAIPPGLGGWVAQTTVSMGPTGGGLNGDFFGIQNYKALTSGGGSTSSSTSNYNKVPVHTPKPSRKKNGNKKANEKKKKSKKEVRKDVVTPSFTKLVEVEGNTLAVADLIHGSEAMKWVRNGAPGLKAVSNSLKTAGTVLGGTGIVLEAIEVGKGDMSLTEFGFDTFVSGAAIYTSYAAIAVGGVSIAPFVAGGALIYVGGKAIYEYKTGNTLFTKPSK